MDTAITMFGKGTIIVISEFVQETNKGLVEKYGVIMNLEQLSDALKMNVRITKSRLKTGKLNITYQEEGKVILIPTIEVAHYIHYPKTRLEREKKNFIFN